MHEPPRASNHFLWIKELFSSTAAGRGGEENFCTALLEGCHVIWDDWVLRVVVKSNYTVPGDWAGPDRSPSVISYPIALP